MNKGKKVILATIGIGTLLTAILVPVFLFTKDNENNQKTDQKTVDDYVEKLKKLTPKEVTIKETSGSITKNKNSILRAIKNLDKFPSIPNGVTLEVKDDSKNLTLQGTAITLVVKKLTITKEVTGFKVKKSKTKVELDTDSIKNVKKILDDKSSKLVTIVNAISKVGASGVATKIVAKLQETIGTSNLDGVTIGVKADATDGDIIDTGQGTGFIITLSKGTAQLVEITNWKVLRTKPTSEQNTDSINNVKTILDGKDPKLVTIENVQAKIGDVGVSNKIVAKLQETIGISNLDGVTVEVKADSTNADIIHTGNGIGFIIKLSKGSVSEEISDWKVKRTKPNEELSLDRLDADSINNVKTILDGKSSKLVTIENTRAKVEDVQVSTKIVAKLQETIGTRNLDGVTVEVKADSTNADIVHTGNGIGFIIKLSKGSVSEEISNWKVLRTKPMFEQNTDSVNNVKTILDGKDPKLVTIENVQAKVGDVGVPEKIVAELEKTIGTSNLDGVTVEVKVDSTNADIIHTGNGIGFIVKLSKGSVSEEISNWKVLRTKPMFEQNTDSVNNVKTILDGKDPKIVTIENTQAKVGDVGVPEKIVAELEKTIGTSNLNGVTVEVKVDSTNADIIHTGNGIGFIVKLSKGSVSEEISNWKVLRTKPMSEQNTDSVNNVKTILDGKDPKIVTIENAQAKVRDVGVPEKIVAELEKVVEPSNLEGVTIGVKADATDGDIIDTGLGTGFIITLSKGSASEETSDWKVKRTKTSDELIADNYKSELTNKYRNPFSNDILIKIDSTSGTLEENKVSIIKAIKATYLFISPPTGLDIRLRPGQNEIIPVTRIVVDIEIFKVSTGKTLALISKNDLYAFVVRRSKTPFEKIDSHFLVQSNKVVNIPYEKPSLTYQNLNENGVLEAVKKALVFANADFWTTTLLNEITLKANQNINNFDGARDVIIKYGEDDNEKEVTINVKKLSSGQTIEEYFKSFKNIEFDISSEVIIRTENDILDAIRNILVNRDSKVWTITKNSILKSTNNELSTLTKAADGYSIFKAAYTIDGSLKEIDLFVRHLSTGSEIEKYFAVIERNYEARKINIPSSTAILDSAEKIFDAVKNYLKVKDPSTWKDQLIDELAISDTNNTISLVKGASPKPFVVEYTNDANEVVTLMLKVKHLSE